MSDIQCVVVTPEKTELDVQADSVVLPMFDGELGVLKGHSPLVGRLGYGVLRIRTGEKVESYFVEGGFAQISDNVVSVLTDKVMPKNLLTSVAASEAMKLALELPTDQPELAAVREKALTRARAMTRLAS